VPDLRRRAEGPEGFFSMVTTDGDGHSKTISGPIGGLGSASPTLPPELARLMNGPVNDLLPDLAEVFGSFAPMLLGRPVAPAAKQTAGPAASPEKPIGQHPEVHSVIKVEEGQPGEYPTASIGAGPVVWVDDAPREQPKQYHGPVATIGDDPRDVAAAKAYSQHSCGEEIMQCRLIGARTGAELKTCLIDNLDKVSVQCKCFITQLEGPDKVQKQLSPSAKAAAAPQVHTIMLEDGHTIPRTINSHGEEHFVLVAQAGHVPMHGPQCFFMMGATFVLMILIMRKCIICCCSAPAAPPQVAIVVPPEQTSIKLLEPLNTADIKAVAVTK
jgi:hypothetical protein